MRNTLVAGSALLLALSSCRGGSLASSSYVTPPASVSESTSFGGMDRALTALRERGRADDTPPPPIALTASDGGGLAMRSLKARAVIDGPLAVTELTMTFHNTENRRREGRFTIALPDGAAVSRLGMMIRGSMMEGEVVPRARAREVYESHLRPQRDPALLERDAGNVFGARVFPIEPHEKKQLVVTYAQEVSATRPYRLHLAGLPVVDALDVEVHSAGGGEPIRRGAKGQAPDDVVVATTGGDALVAGDAAVIRFAPALQTPPDPIAELVFLVDTSASRGGDLRAQADAVATLIRTLGTRGMQRVEVAAFDQTVVPLVSGAPDDVADRVVDAIMTRGALGASDVGAALKWASGRGRRAILVGDGIATAGTTEPRALAAEAKATPRIDALVIGGRGDREALLAVVGAGKRPGVILDDGDADAGTWAGRLSRGVASDVAIEVDGATWVWPEKLESIQPGDEVVVMARLAKRAPKSLDVRAAGTAVRLSPRKAHDAVVGRAVAGAEIARRRRTLGTMSVLERDAALAEMTEMAVKHRLLTDETGLLVLETEYDYERWCLDRSALADVIAIRDGAIHVVDRSGGKGVTLHCKIDTNFQSTSNESIVGFVRDQQTGEPMIGATVVATGPALNGQTQAAISDENGRYAITNLPAGTYDVTIYYLDIEQKRTGVVVAAPPAASSGTVNATGITIDREYTRNIPVPGRTFESALGAAAGSQSDGLGVSFSGSTSLENQYYVDGVNTTGLNFGVTSSGGGEMIQISDKAPTIDPTSTHQGVTLSDGFFTGTDFRGPRLPSRSSSSWDLEGSSDDHYFPPSGGRAAWHGRYARVAATIRSGESHRAVADAVKWQMSAPGDLLAVQALGEALEASGRGALAARAYGSILDLFPRRAELARAAGQRLERIGGAATRLAIDAYRRALADRPDHATTYRLLAWALVRKDDFDEAMDILEKGMIEAKTMTAYSLREDIALIAAAALARHPERRAEIARRLHRVNVSLPTEPSIRFVLHWETDASDVDLHVIDRDGNRAWDQNNGLDGNAMFTTTADSGWGPETFVISTRDARKGPYRLAAYLEDKGPQGHILGTLQIIQHDGHGGFLFDHRPFVISEQGAYVDLGSYR
jgi:hypothetical protein